MRRPRHRVSADCPAARPRWSPLSPATLSSAPPMAPPRSSSSRAASFSGSPSAARADPVGTPPSGATNVERLIALALELDAFDRPPERCRRPASANLSASPRQCSAFRSKNERTPGFGHRGGCKRIFMAAGPGNFSYDEHLQSPDRPRNPASLPEPPEPGLLFCHAIDCRPENRLPRGTRISSHKGRRGLKKSKDSVIQLGGERISDRGIKAGNRDHEAGEFHRTARRWALHFLIAILLSLVALSIPPPRPWPRNRTSRRKPAKKNGPEIPLPAHRQPPKGTRVNVDRRASVLRPGHRDRGRDRPGAR